MRDCRPQVLLGRWPDATVKAADDLFIVPVLVVSMYYDELIPHTLLRNKDMEDY